MPITHAKVSAIADGADTSIVRPSDWNAEHEGNNFVWFNVMDYGATGDGIADDTSEIQAAIDAADDWGTVFFPSGTYKISAALTVGKNLRLLGSGGYPGHGTYLLQYTNNTNAITVTGVYYLTVESMFIENEGGTAASGAGIYAYATIVTRHVYLGKFYDGLFIDGVNGASYFSHLADSWFDTNTRAGVFIDGKVNNIRISGIRATSNTYGIYATGGVHGASVVASDFEDNSNSGIYWDGVASAQNTDALYIGYCYFENDALACIKLGTTSLVQNATIQSCHLEGINNASCYLVDTNYVNRLAILGNHLAHGSEAGGIRCNVSNTTNVLYQNVHNDCSVQLPPTSRIVDPASGFSQIASVTVNASVAETTLTGTGVGSLTIPANYLSQGRVIRVKASGYLGTQTTPTLRIKVKFGSTILLDTGANSLPSSVSNRGWSLEGTITCRTVGTSGSVLGQGVLIYNTTSHTVGVIDDFTPNTAATTVNTTTTQTVDVTCQWGTSHNNNTITCTNLTLEII